jgi:hypothetical protein
MTFSKLIKGNVAKLTLLSLTALLVIYILGYFLEQTLSIGTISCLKSWMFRFENRQDLFRLENS